jgi:hypothetical protein
MFDASKMKRLEDDDLPRIGKAIGVGEDELHAFMEVEAAGSGIDSKGRLKMLFEPHIFWRELGPGRNRDKAIRAGLAYARWKKSYPKDSYPRLAAAMNIDREAALRSASWGLPQLMGFNAKLAGYDTAEAMVKDFTIDEDNHVEAMVRFIKARNLDDDLRRRDWRAVENGYNGGGFKGAYAVKMEKAFAKWQKVKDTPLPKDAHVGQTEPTVQPPAENAKTAEAGGIAGAVVVGGGVAAKQAGFPWETVLLGCGVIASLVAIAWLVYLIRKEKSNAKNGSSH